MIPLVDGDVLARVPIFPLPSVVLFPATLLPLHVFEPRYLRMIGDVLASDAPWLGVVRLTDDWEQDYAGRPPVCDRFGLGQVVEHQLAPDGRRNILVRGIARAAIVRELPPDEPYRAVDCRILGSTPPSSDLAARMATLRSLLATWLASVPGLDLSQASTLFEPGIAAEQVVDSAASALPFEADVRQALLEELDVEARVDRLIEALVDLPPAS
jgi:Lon protease-like protein